MLPSMARARSDLARLLPPRRTFMRFGEGTSEPDADVGSPLFPSIFRYAESTSAMSSSDLPSASTPSVHSAMAPAPISTAAIP